MLDVAVMVILTSNIILAGVWIRSGWFRWFGGPDLGEFSLAHFLTSVAASVLAVTYSLATWMYVVGSQIWPAKVEQCIEMISH